MRGSGVVDASGVVSSVLSGYRRVLAECRRRVTGDPGALSAASQRVAAQASTVSREADEIGESAKNLHADWDGDACTAFAAAAGKLGEELADAAAELGDQANRLSIAARLVQSAEAAVDSVIAQFDQYAAQLTAQARAVNSASVGAFIQAARQLGEQSAEAAREVVDEFSDALAELFPPEGVGRLEHELGKWARGPLHWLNGEPLDGRKRPRTVPSWFGNSGWKKLTWDGLEGTRAPKKADTPFGQPEPEGVKQKLARNTEITYYKFQHDQDGWSPEYDGKITSKGWDAGASGHAELAAFHGELEAKKEWGVAEAHANGTAFAGGEVSASGTIGAHGFGGHVNAFAGGKVEGEVAADVAGIGVGANGTLQYGLGAQLDAQAVYDAGHIKVNFKAGAALGLGLGVGAKIDIDLPKLGHTIGEYGGAAVDVVGHAASDAAEAVASAWDDAVAYVGSW
ncbi:WXG100 family type VII secretion target [Amycolatopsis australiensis]|uniref:Proteins of 100 residues with WXG n=1 Tax=Amycolatopsis australiensis TaxID=546364 RepID=A0A1K1T1Q0_9PSEU|nr:WXG100 family type VII secretion target [Amycolatopsis australiensis]SFW90498.1 Proteins of 100 residues with WXG [Amycolatopsis australiensis]